MPGEAITSVGSGTYTGGAISADGRVVALRTYTDAWLYPAPGGTATAEDVVTALSSPPVRVPLLRRGPGRGAGLRAGRDAAGDGGDAVGRAAGAPARRARGDHAGDRGHAGHVRRRPAPERAGLPEPLTTIGVVVAVALGVFALVAVVAVVRRRRTSR